jgi:hypothetical protein
MMTMKTIKLEVKITISKMMSEAKWRMTLTPQPRGSQNEIQMKFLSIPTKFITPALSTPPSILDSSQSKWRRFRSDSKQEAAAAWLPS